MVVYFFCCRNVVSCVIYLDLCFYFPKKKITVRFSGGCLGAGSLVRFKVVCCVFPVHDKCLRLFLDALPVSDLLECKLLRSPHLFTPCTVCYMCPGLLHLTGQNKRRAVTETSSRGSSHSGGSSAASVSQGCLGHFFFKFSFDLIKHDRDDDSKSDFISPGLIQLPPIYGVKRPHTQMDKSHTLVVEPVLVHTRIRAGDVGLRA